MVIDSLRTLCKFLHVDELSDRKAMLTQISSHRGESVCRIAGSYVRRRNVNSEEKSTMFFVGKSSGHGTEECTSTYADQRVQVELPGQQEEPAIGDAACAEEGNRSFVLYRQSASWDDDVQNYKTLLRSCWRGRHRLGDQRLITEGSKAHAFKLIWNKYSPASKRRWTSSLTQE